jgi:hypothetical protein
MERKFDKNFSFSKNPTTENNQPSTCNCVNRRRTEISAQLFVFHSVKQKNNNKNIIIYDAFLSVESPWKRRRIKQKKHLNQIVINLNLFHVDGDNGRV